MNTQEAEDSWTPLALANAAQRCELARETNGLLRGEIDLLLLRRQLEKQRPREDGPGGSCCAGGDISKGGGGGDDDGDEVISVGDDSTDGGGEVPRGGSSGSSDGDAVVVLDRASDPAQDTMVAPASSPSAAVRHPTTMASLLQTAGATCNQCKDGSDGS